MAQSARDQKDRVVEEKTTNLEQQIQEWSKKSIEFVVILEVGDTKLTALVDTGATKSLLTEQAYMKIKDNCNPLRVSPNTLKGISGRNLPVLGNLDFNFKLDNSTY